MMYQIRHGNRSRLWYGRLSACGLRTHEGSKQGYRKAAVSEEQCALWSGTRAFEGVLQSMVELDNPKAAVILDEFRIH